MVKIVTFMVNDFHYNKKNFLIKKRKKRFDSVKGNRVTAKAF